MQAQLSDFLFNPEKAALSKIRSLLIVLPVPFRYKNQQLLFESQACNGLERWADNFGSLIVAAPLMPESLAQEAKTMVWRDTTTLHQPQRFELVPLPWAHSFKTFWAYYPQIRAVLRRLIQRSCLLQFAIGGLIGDWAAVAAIEAHNQHRTYAIHADVVEYQGILKTAEKAAWNDRLKAFVMSVLMKHYYNWIIQQADLGLWHGADCYSAYSPLCKRSFLIHNTHTKSSDCIDLLKLAEKSNHVLSTPVLRICYAGRMEVMKAPLDWIRAIGVAKNLGVNLQAVWLGDGKLFNEMTQTVTEQGLEACIELAGFERDRQRLLQRIRESDLMVFTHITPESPRCLIEALISGTPIVGYRSNYAEDLVKAFGGGVFVPIGEWEQLGKTIAELARDRQHLSRLVQEAGESGARFNDEAVFQERSELIKKHLKPREDSKLDFPGVPQEDNSLAVHSTVYD
jgi:glycosyltransferase involved in cell wall biosynthesis